VGTEVIVGSTVISGYIIALIAFDTIVAFVILFK
jgi:hypothetical protein